MFVWPFEVLHGYPPRRSLSRDHVRTTPSLSRRHLAPRRFLPGKKFSGIFTDILVKTIGNYLRLRYLCSFTLLYILLSLFYLLVFTYLFYLFLFYLQGNGERFVSVANAQCRRMITMLHARSVGWRLANVTLILRIPVISVGDGRPSNSQSLGGPW